MFANFMKFRHCLFKILKNQNGAGGRTDGRENSARTLCTHSLRGYKNVNAVYQGDLESHDQSATTLLGDISNGLFDVIFASQ